MKRMTEKQAMAQANEFEVDFHMAFHAAGYAVSMREVQQFLDGHTLSRTGLVRAAIYEVVGSRNLLEALTADDGEGRTSARLRKLLTLLRKNAVPRTVAFELWVEDLIGPLAEKGSQLLGAQHLRGAVESLQPGARFIVSKRQNKHGMPVLVFSQVTQDEIPPSPEQMPRTAFEENNARIERAQFERDDLLAKMRKR